MAFHHRKFLISEPDCYMCYVCPENCYVPPPPPQLSPPPSLPPQFSVTGSSKHHVPTVLIMMLCILGVAFLVLSYLTLARYRCRNSRSRNQEPLESSRNFLDENRGPVLDHPVWFIRTVGLPQSAIDAIASFAYRKADGLVDGRDCAVCLSDFQEGEMLRLLPKCSHAFHLDCIDTWLRSHKNCPVCRAPILVAGMGNNARASTGETGPSSSGSREVTRDDDLERDHELGETRPIRGGENGNIASKNEARIELIRVVSDLVDDRVRLGDGDDLQPIRRSVSMDFSMTRNSNLYKVIVSSNPSRKGYVSMKKSFSFTGKLGSMRKNSDNDPTS